MDCHCHEKQTESLDHIAYIFFFLWETGHTLFKHYFLTNFHQQPTKLTDYTEEDIEACISAIPKALELRENISWHAFSHGSYMSHFLGLLAVTHFKSIPSSGQGFQVMEP